jgi:hypothetical protein
MEKKSNDDVGAYEACSDGCAIAERQKCAQKFSASNYHFWVVWTGPRDDVEAAAG